MLKALSYITRRITIQSNIALTKKEADKQTKQAKKQSNKPAYLTPSRSLPVCSSTRPPQPSDVPPADLARYTYVQRSHHQSAKHEAIV